MSPIGATIGSNISPTGATVDSNISPTGATVDSKISPKGAAINAKISVVDLIRFLPNSKNRLDPDPFRIQIHI